MAGKELLDEPSGLTHGTVPPPPAGLAAQGVCPAYHRFDVRAAVHFEFVARLAAPGPGQLVLGERHYVFAPSQWHVGLPVHLSGRVYQARSGLAGAG